MKTIWEKITAGELITPVNGEHVAGSLNTVFTGLNTDSRETGPGQLFLALKGERYNGHEFIDSALKKGAAGIIMESGHVFHEAGDAVIIRVADTLRALGDLAGWWRHQHSLQVVAITGSAGKTTTKEMTAGILELGSGTLKNPGNFNNLIGLPLTLLNLKQEHRRAVLEMGMNHPGEIARLTEIADPDIGLITNVAGAHLEGLGDITGVAEAKTELIGKISPDGMVILNGDDQLLIKTASRFSRKVTTYGLGKGNHVRAENIIEMGHEGITFDLIHEGQSTHARIKVPGRQNLYNALAASAVCVCMGEPLERIIRGLEKYKGIKGRFMVNTLPGDMVLIDDTYNSNPFSLKAAITSARELAAGNRRMIIGLGEMLELGKETTQAHYEAGAMVAEAGAAFFFALGDHAGDMIKGALDGGLTLEKAVTVRSQEEMEQKIRDTARERDLILLKGSRMMALDKVSEGLKGHKAEVT